MKYGLPPSTHQNIRQVLERYPEVKKAILYGSRAKGTEKRGSDSDLTLCGDADVTIHGLSRILNDLDDLLLPPTIDLSIFGMITDPDVIDRIHRAGVTVYEKSETVPEGSSRPPWSKRVSVVKNRRHRSISVPRSGSDHEQHVGARLQAVVNALANQPLPGLRGGDKGDKGGAVYSLFRPSSDRRQCENGLSMCGV